MLYVKRNSKNRIVAIYNSPQSDATEEVPIHSQELIAFLFADQNADDPFMQSEQSLQGLYLSDLGMIRIIEDLIDVLIDKKRYHHYRSASTSGKPYSSPQKVAQAFVSAARAYQRQK